MESSLIIRLSLFGISCIGVTFILGCARRFPLGFAATLSAGAYTAACLRMFTGIPWPACILFACMSGALIGALPAVFDKALEGDEHVVFSWMVALGFAEAIGLMQITGGQHSLIGIPPLLEGTNAFAHAAWLVVTVFAVVVAFAYRFRRTNAYEEACLAGLNPTVLSMAGRSSYTTSLKIHVVGGTLGGLAGAFWGPVYGTLHPSLFGLPESVVFLLVCLIGGQGEPLGVIVGLAIVFLLPPLLHFDGSVGGFAALSRSMGVAPPDPDVVVSSLNQAFLGLLLVISVVWLQRGVMPFVQRAWISMRHRRQH